MPTTLKTPLSTLLTPFSLLLLLLCLLTPHVQPQYIAPIPALPAPANTPITATYHTPNPDLSELSAPKLSAVNASAFEWWYFDAVAAHNPNLSAVVTFFTSAPAAFPMAPRNGSSVVWSYVYVSLPDAPPAPAPPPPGDEGRDGDGDRDGGTGGGSGGNDRGDKGPNLEVWIGWDGSRISGRLRLENATSPRTPCTTSQRFDPSLRLGSVGWVNIVPHAKATVDLIVDGEAVKFEGYGYHDKNWSERPFHSLVKKWFWGHAHVGPYSLVWFQETPLNSTIPVASASVLKDGVTVLSGCEAGIVSVQRVGHAAASGFAVEVVMRGVRVTMLGTREVAGDGQHFFRWSGTVDGEVLGQKVNGGVAVFEEFDL
ncbi:uncharacterized protein BO95DRAFT_355940 [Aspergillus brunneoviolaceus CBS 621.78]|uniref:Uncharacterized protein n=1 Tax=Aspergillus brunneoviolaceus CBS 621.78 TaxID=1450534 RepID=A0ACD1GHX7_9EURO|nr:hypothetical protein BO95DRAFT_355940 [Aspergillus brunneoviolaceus CBS 621.78]RAH48845.1 hypothetical protein BO95DRAFT_355940 [Aspergillus brunneoviolaceus CBS 621.78]